MLQETFLKTVHSELDDFLSGFGFRPLGNLVARATYSDGHRLVSIAYWPEEASPWLEIDVGLTGPSGEAIIVGLWRVTTEACSTLDPSEWWFNSSEELLALLLQFKQDLWMKCVLPALENPIAVEAASRKERLEAGADAADTAVRQLIALARQHLERGDLEGAATLYAQIPADRIPRRDHLRLSRARRLKQT